ncbi:MAG: hypothetical protein AB7H97_04040 [Pseudobdellovibrionaceae bacterium]
MRQIFLQYAKQGAMTSEELAAVLRRARRWVINNSGLPGSEKLIPRLPGKPIRFDPMVMADVFCPVQPAKKPRSLTIERHKAGAIPNGGYRKCL